MTVDVPLRKYTLRGGERIVQADPEGKQALTLFRIKEQFSDSMLVEAELKSGRTHQIRVHMGFIGCPVVGDSLYGRRHKTLPVKRQSV